MGAAILGYGDSSPLSSPLLIPGLVLWLKADTGTFQDTAFTTAAVADADPVGGWQDQSGSGNHVTQATASKRPVLKLAIQNSKSVLRGDAVDDLLISPSFSVGTLVTMFAVVSVNVSTSFGTPITHTNAGGTALALNGSTAKPEFTYNSGVSIYPSAVTIPSFHVWAGYYDGTSLGFLEDNIPATTTTVASVARTGTVGIFGRTTPANLFNGDIGEILYYNSLLTAAQRTQVYGYLKTLWGTP